MEAIYEHVLLSNDTGESLVLKNAPVGWDEQKFNLIRDLKYFGIFKKISVEYEFVGDGYEFLQRHKLRKGVDANVTYRCYKEHVFLYEGKVNFLVHKDIRKFNRFSVDIIQSDFVQKFQTREDKKLNVLNDISIDRNSVIPAELKTALIRGKKINFFSQFEGTTQTQPEVYHHIVPFLLKVNGNPGVQSPTGIYADTWNPYEPIPAGAPGNEYPYAGNPSPLGVPENSFYRNTLPESQEVTINWKFNANFNYLGPNLSDFEENWVIYKYILCNEDGTPVELLWYNLFQLDVTGQNFNFDFTFSHTRTYLPGQYVILVCERFIQFAVTAYRPGTGIELDSVVRTEITYNTMEMTIESPSVITDTTSPVILPHELFSNLIAQINGGTFYSEFFGRTDIGYDEIGKGALVGITTGAMLRGIPIDEIQVSTSFRDAFVSYSSIFCLGAIVQDKKIIVEPLESLFNNELATDLGTVKDLVTTPATEFLFNSVLAGYPKNEYEQENGRDEYNTQTQYTNSLSAASKEYSMLSVYYGDGYGVEFARRLNIKFTGTQDSRYDDKIFFIDLVDDGSGGLMSRRLEGILLAEGIFSPETAMNLRIAIEQNMKRHGKLLNVAVDKKSDKNYYPQSKDKNNKLHLVTEELGETTAGEPVDVGGVAQFIPEERQFEAPIRLNNLFEILQNPLGLVRYDYEDEEFFDYLFECDMETEKHHGPWRMLATKDSPVSVTDQIWGPYLKYGEGPTDFVRWSLESEEGVIQYK